MPEPVFLYWDANIFLSYINNEPTRVQVIDAIFENIQKNQKEKIVTSVISKVEVAWASIEKLNRALSQIEEDKIDDLWNDESVIELVDFNDDIALLARSIMRQGMINHWRLKTNDAIHLASAQWVQASEINTYDIQKLSKFQAIIGIDIKEPLAIQPKLF